MATDSHTWRPSAQAQHAEVSIVITEVELLLSH